MKSRPLPPIEYLRSRIELDAQGIARWRPFRGNGFKAEWIGQPVGRLADHDGVKRKHVSLNHRQCLLSRIVYAISSGIDPGDLHVDHINGDTLDDRPENLRAATPVQNSRNRAGAQSNNGTGVRNVFRHPKGGFSVYVGERYRGYFQSLDVASKFATEIREREFGEFAGSSVRQTISRGSYGN